MKNNRILALAVTTLLSAPVVHAAADITLSATGTDAGLVFAKELPSATGALKTTGKIIQIPTPSGIKVISTNPVYVKVNLLNGATFSTTNPTLSCASAGGAAGVGVSASKSNNGMGTNSVTFLLAPRNATPAATSAFLGSACQMKMGNIGVTGLTDKSITATVEYRDASTTTNFTSKGKFITFKQGLQVTYTPEAGNQKIDVAKSSKKFDDGKVVAALGYVKYDVGTVAASNSSGANISVGDVLSSVKLSISGPAVGSVHSGTVGLSGIYILATANNPAKCLVNSSFTPQYSGTTVTFAGIKATALSNGLLVCLVGTGSNVIADGQITADLSGAVAVNGASPILTATRNSLKLLKKNGSSTKALVLPNPSSTDKPYVRIYNIGSGSGRVLGTLYGVDGKVIGTSGGVLSASLAPNAVAVLDATAIATAMGVTTWPARAWLQIEAEFQGLRAQALIRSSTGVLTEMSDGACANAAACGD